MSPRSQGRDRQKLVRRRPGRLLRACICCGLLGAPAALLGGTAPASAAPNDVLVVGDSLAVGTEPYLAAMLSDRNIVTAIKSGITTPIGMEYIRRKLRVITPQTVVISLGSNDGSDPHRFADRLRRTMELLPDDACVIWATIIRPARKGEYRGLNRVLNQARRDDPRIVLIDWEHAVTQGDVFLPDNLHPNAAGFRYRATMITNAVHTECVAAGLDGS
jgi:lysophospholipase L1-like esterase